MYHVLLNRSRRSFAAPGSLLSKYFRELQVIKSSTRWVSKLVTKSSIADHDVNKPLFTEKFASSAAHVMDILPLTRLIFDNFFASVMTTGNKMVEKTDTILPVPKRHVAKTSPARDCMTSKSRENNKTENQSCSFMSTITLRNS